jgi:hypothetical protein
MKRFAILLLFLSVTCSVFAVFTRLTGKYRRIGAANNEYVVVEKTGASTEELIAGTSGENIAVHAIIGSVTTACKMYLGYGTATALTKVTPVYDLAAQDQINIVLNDPITLPAGEGLDMWTSADPNEGWFGIAFDSYDYEDGEGTAY